MTVNYTTLLGLAQPVTGTEAGTWGTVVNNEITALVEEAIARGTSINVTAGDVTLTTTTGASNQARNAILLITGTPGVSRNVIAPSSSKVYIIVNGSNAAVVIKGAATTGVTVATGATSLVAWNGSDFVEVGQAGDVDGPTSSTDNAAVRFDGTSGKLVQNSGVIIDDSNNVSGMGTLGVGAITTTGVFTATAGTVSAPAITTTGDTNTGIFFPAADTIAFTEGGVEAMRIDSSGNLGIGTISPGAKLDVSGLIRSAGDVANFLLLEKSANTGVYARWKRPNREYYLALDINNNGGNDFSLYDATAAATRWTVDSSGNLGLGVTPSGWGSGIKAFEIGSVGNGVNVGVNGLILNYNSYYNGGWKYASSFLASLYEQTAGAHAWYTAPSGTINNAITFTQAMTLDASGNLGIGNTTPSSYNSAADNLVIGSSGSNGMTIVSGTTSAGYIMFADGTSGQQQYEGQITYDHNSNYMDFRTAGLERMRIDSSGNVGIGVTPSAWGSGYKALQLGTNGVVYNTSGNNYFGSNVYNDGTNLKRITTAAVGLFGVESGSKYVWYQAGSDTAGTTITLTQAMTLDASGRLGIGETSPSYKLQVKGGNFNQLILDNAGEQYTAMAYYNNGATKTDFYWDQTNTTFNIRTRTTAPLIFITADVERARITSGGYFKASDSGTYNSSTGAYHEFYQTAADWTLQLKNTNASPLGIVVTHTTDSNGTGNEFLYLVGAATLRASIRSNGGLANYSANNVNLASDERLKKDISPLDTSWDKVKAIEVVNFRYKDCNEGDPLLYGVIAQQVQPIVPELVVVTQEAKEAVEAKESVLDEEGNVIEPAVAAKEATPEYFGIREQPMYWLAIKALQEAMTRIEALEAEVAAMKGN